MRFVVVLLVAAVVVGAGCEPLGVGRPERDTQETLAREAKVSMDRAGLAALAQVPGSVQHVRLKRETGLVVYHVTIRPEADPTMVDVTVDSGTAWVIRVEPARLPIDYDDGEI